LLYFLYLFLFLSFHLNHYWWYFFLYHGIRYMLHGW
jgi:hypothetical protein